jgi:predicted dehydrogenase
MSVTRWAILGPGAIAVMFAKALKAVDGAERYTVAGRSGERAHAFAKEHGFSRYHDTVADALADPQVDAVYIATPHTAHLGYALEALGAGKPCLVEKPLGINSAQVRTLIDTARDRSVFLMEAMWTRFLPVMDQVRRWIQEGRIGELRLVEASFCFRSGWNPKSRLLDPELAGSGLLDVGIYPVALACDFFNSEPSQVQCLATLGDTGVDEQASLNLAFPGGGLASLTCGVRTLSQHRAVLYGSEGMISIAPPFWRSTEVTLHDHEHQPVDVVCLPHRANGYEYEAEAVASALAAGAIEHPLCRHADSLAIAKVLDQARAQIGLRYPADD